jgi:hypothetical protein
VLVEVSGEPGQVVETGKAVATLARDGEREVEVFFPGAARPPAAGQLVRADGAPLLLRLREVSGSVDPQSRTWRARYSVSTGGDALALGSVVRAALATPGHNDQALSVPIAALDERGEGPRVWQVVASKPRFGQDGAICKSSFKTTPPKPRSPICSTKCASACRMRPDTCPRGGSGPLVNDDFSDVYFKLIALTAAGHADA